MAHWHDFNPWADRLVYVPDLDEFVNCLITSMNHKEYMTYVYSYGRRLDAYVLPQSSGDHSAGVRFGPRGSDYLSPLGDRKMLQKLIDKYGGTP